MAISLTLAEFRSRFSEFTDTPDALVQSKLDEAWRETPTGIWGDRTHDGQAALAAHLLASTAYGRDARVANDDGSTMYGARRREMELQIGVGASPRVV